MTTEQKIVLLAQNLMFMPRIMSAAQAAGLTTRYANSAPDFWAVFEEGLPALVLVDLEGDPVIWTEVLEELQASADGDATATTTDFAEEDPDPAFNHFEAGHYVAVHAADGAVISCGDVT